MRDVVLGIIGCGGIANGKHMPSLSKLDNVKMVAFCDVVKEKAEKAAEKYGVEGARVYTDYKKMLAKEKDLEVVHVCTPNKSHSPITVAALESGCHVMCEKPMAKTYADAKAMLEAHKKTGKKLTIGYQNRFKAESTFVKACCDDGELGEIYYGKAIAIRRRAVPTWGVFLNEEEQGGGPLIDIGTHALDLTLWMMDNYKPVSVKGNVYKKLGDMKNSGNAWGDWDPEKFTVEDSAFGFITMENGATIVLESSWALNTLYNKEAICSLCGTKAGADMEDGARINLTKHGKLTTIKPSIGSAGVDFYAGAEEAPADIEARQWIQAVVNDTDPVVKPEQAIVVTQILEAIYESAKTGKEVLLND
ncbi:MAG: Gfo/Idh/MocA family oxidoreductase [Eubacteriales bacterium]|nr:Gfo/Idh/MocA family oxidoreductase [Eubacteriales bacterium]